MAAPYTTILQKVEDALAIRIATEATLAAVPVTILKGVSVTAVSPPCIIIAAESAEPRPMRKGNQRVTVKVTLMTQSDDTASAVSTHRSRTGLLADVLMTTTIATDLSADLADLLVFGVLDGGQRQVIEGRKWAWEYTMLIDCMPADS